MATATSQSPIVYPDPPKLPDPPVAAGFWRRGLALLIDGLVACAAVLPFALVAGGVGAFDEGASTGIGALGGGLMAAGALTGIGIAPRLMDRSGERNGQSLGKQAMGIRVIRRNRDAVDLDLAVGREFGLKGVLFGALPLGIASLIAGAGDTAGAIAAIAALSIVVNDYIWATWHADRRTWHDHVANTEVVKA